MKRYPVMGPHIQSGTISGARSPVESPGGFPLVRSEAGGGEELVAQAHGGALLPGGKPGNDGGRVTAEKHKVRKERSEAITDAITGHIEKLTGIMGDLVEAAGGEQWRCSCGLMGPKQPKLQLKEAADVVRLLLAAVKDPGEGATVIPIQVNVLAGAQIIPNPIP